MKYHLVKPYIFLILIAGNATGALHADIAGGYSTQSAYHYYGELPDIPWLTFDPANAFCASTRLSVDIWKDSFRFGISGGFLRRYRLTLHAQTETDPADKHVGDMVSIPLIGFLEGRQPPFFFEFGLGPYITRCNYTRSNLPDYSVTSLFGFLFGCGYEKYIFSGVSLLARGELLVNAPVFLIDHVDKQLKNMVRESRYTEYNINEFQTVIYTAAINVGVQYEFGKRVRIPVDDAFFTLKRGLYDE